MSNHNASSSSWPPPPPGSSSSSSSSPPPPPPPPPPTESGVSNETNNCLEEEKTALTMDPFLSTIDGSGSGGGGGGSAIADSYYLHNVPSENETTPPWFFASSPLDEDRVEDDYVASLEEKRLQAKRRYSSSSGNGGSMVWDAALGGEHPLLGSIPLSPKPFYPPRHDLTTTTRRRPPLTPKNRRLTQLAQQAKHRIQRSRSNSRDTPDWIPTTPPSPPPPPPPPYASPRTMPGVSPASSSLSSSSSPLSQRPTLISNRGRSKSTSDAIQRRLRNLSNLSIVSRMQQQHQQQQQQQQQHTSTIEDWMMFHHHHHHQDHNSNNKNHNNYETNPPFRIGNRSRSNTDPRSHPPQQRRERRWHPHNNTYSTIHPDVLRHHDNNHNDDHHHNNDDHYQRKHRHNQPHKHPLFERVGGDGDQDLGVSNLAVAHTATDRLIFSAAMVESLFDGARKRRRRPKTNQHTSMTSPQATPRSWESNNHYGSQGTSSPEAPTETTSMTGTNDDDDDDDDDDNHNRKRKKKKKALLSLHNTGLVEVLNPRLVWRGLWSFLFDSAFTYVTLPCLLGAVLCYYKLSNPVFWLRDRPVAVSWFLVFAARQALTLELAKATNYLVVEGLALRTRWLVRYCGPLLTLFVTQTQGWPGVAVWWTLWDVAILHGDAPFCLHWAYRLRISLFSKTNPGWVFLKTPFYTTVLAAVFCLGLANAMKRTTVAMHFGRRTFANFKEKLEEILDEIVLITEVAELAWEIEATELDLLPSNEEDLDIHQSVGHLSTGPSRQPSTRSHLSGTQSSTMRRSTNKWQAMRPVLSRSKLTVDTVPSQVIVDEKSRIGGGGGSEDASSDHTSDMEEEEEEEEEEQKEDARQNDNKEVAEKKDDSDALMDDDVGILGLLPFWKEPTSKVDNAASATIGDILVFRKALTYMDDEYPFSFAFGQASTREVCCRSAQRTFRRLTDGDKNSNKVSFDAINVLAITEDGYLDETKQKDMRRLFRPDHNNDVSLASFVQACDNVYKQLRYFRASVANASLIDKFLEDIISNVFNGLLVLLLLSALGFNPYPVLVSMAALLVSTTFAFKTSAANYIEGVFMILVRRPYDLGDKINLDVPTNIGLPSPLNWQVQDITLFTTTLRQVRTHDVCTINNGSIATLRIINRGRSPNAIITVMVYFNLHTHKDRIMEFKRETQQHIKEHPSVWTRLAYFYCSTININSGYLEYTLLAQNVKPWQNGLQCAADQGALMQWCYEKSRDMGIAFSGSVQRVAVDHEKKFIDPTIERSPPVEPQ